MDWNSTFEGYMMFREHIPDPDVEAIVEEKEDNKYEDWLLSEYDKQFNA